MDKTIRNKKAMFTYTKEHLKETCSPMFDEQSLECFHQKYILL